MNRAMDDIHVELQMGESQAAFAGLDNFTLNHFCPITAATHMSEWSLSIASEGAPRARGPGAIASEIVEKQGSA